MVIRFHGLVMKHLTRTWKLYYGNYGANRCRPQTQTQQTSSTTHTRITWQSVDRVYGREAKTSRRVFTMNLRLKHQNRLLPAARRLINTQRNNFYLTRSKHSTPSWKHFPQVELPEIHRVYRKSTILWYLSLSGWEMSSVRRFWSYRTALITVISDSVLVTSTHLSLHADNTKQTPAASLDFISSHFWNKHRSASRVCVKAVKCAS